MQKLSYENSLSRKIFQMRIIRESRERFDKEFGLEGHKIEAKE